MSAEVQKQVQMTSHLFRFIRPDSLLISSKYPTVHFDIAFRICRGLKAANCHIDMLVVYYNIKYIFVLRISSSKAIVIHVHMVPGGSNSIFSITFFKQSFERSHG